MKNERRNLLLGGIWETGNLITAALVRTWKGSWENCEPKAWKRSEEGEGPGGGEGRPLCCEDGGFTSHILSCTGLCHLVRLGRVQLGKLRPRDNKWLVQCLTSRLIWNLSTNLSLCDHKHCYSLAPKRRKHHLRPSPLKMGVGSWIMRSETMLLHLL